MKEWIIFTYFRILKDNELPKNIKIGYWGYTNNGYLAIGTPTNSTYEVWIKDSIPLQDFINNNADLELLRRK